MIPLFKVAMSKTVDYDLLKVLHSGWIGEGEKVKEFENKLSNFFNNNKVLSLSSGTHGLTLALRLAGVGKGDEVITTPLTCQATCQPILQCGADIVWADINKDFNIDPESIKENITNKTKAIIVVHWGGYPCDMEQIQKVVIDHMLTGKHNRIIIIEDAAHAYGSSYYDDEYYNHKIGDCSHSDFCMFSFQAIKQLTTIDGGALCCRNIDDYKRGKLLRWYGINREIKQQDMRCSLDNPIQEWGYKFHMNDVCATIGINNMKLAFDNILIGVMNASYYNVSFTNFDGIELTQLDSRKYSSYWLYTILVEDRDNFIKSMIDKGIYVSRVHERLDKHPMTEKYQKDLLVLESIIDKLICIPVGWWVTKEDREYIVESIKKGW